MKFELKLLDWWWNKQVLKSDKKRAAKLTKTTGVSAIKDLEYIGDGSKWHLMDVYRPKGTENEKLPVIIDIHGGGWMYGDKDLYGEARVQDFLAAHRGASPRELLTLIFSELVRFRGEEPQSDDITMLAFCRTHCASVAQPASPRTSP